MAGVVKFSSVGVVKIRFNSMDLGTTRWKEGSFEIQEKDNKSSLSLKFNCGGPPKTFLVNEMRRVFCFLIRVLQCQGLLYCLLYFHQMLDHIKCDSFRIHLIG